MAMNPCFESKESCLSRLYEEFQRLVLTKITVNINISNEEINSIVDVPKINKPIIRSKSFPLMLSELDKKCNNNTQIQPDRSMTRAVVYSSKQSMEKTSFNFLITEHRNKADDFHSVKSLENFDQGTEHSSAIDNNTGTNSSQDLRETIL